MNMTMKRSAAVECTSVANYEPLVGPAAVERILGKARVLHDLHIVNVNSMYYVGGVAEILSSLTLRGDSAAGAN